MKSSIQVELPEGVDPFTHNTTRPSRAKLRAFSDVLKRVAGGGLLQRSSTRPTATVGTAVAFGTVVAASVQAADTVTINGKDLTAANGSPTAEQFDMSGTDIECATSLAAAINSTSTEVLIIQHVKATNIKGTIAMSSATAGSTVTIANITLKACNVTATPQIDEFDIATGNDTTDATNLKNCINSHPALSALGFATSSTSTVTFWQFNSSTPLHITKTGTIGTITDMAATATCLVYAIHKGRSGNAITLASSNARLTVSGARLTGGTATVITF